jgi:hypothetical protein
VNLNEGRCDALTRSVIGGPSRRDVLRGLIGAGLGVGAARLPAGAAAGKTRRPHVSATPLAASTWAAIAETTISAAPASAKEGGGSGNAAPTTPAAAGQATSHKVATARPSSAPPARATPKGCAPRRPGTAGTASTAAAATRARRTRIARSSVDRGAPASSATTARIPVARPAAAPTTTGATSRRSPRWQSGQRRPDPGFRCRHPDLAPGEALLERNDS